jgi:hypothetical protein
MRTPHLRNVLTTRVWVGALRAVTSAVRMGDWPSREAVLDALERDQERCEGPRVERHLTAADLVVL